MFLFILLSWISLCIHQKGFNEKKVIHKLLISQIKMVIPDRKYLVMKILDLLLHLCGKNIFSVNKL